MNNVEFGNYIKKLREEKKYSQRKLAYLTELSNSTISRIEKGETSPDLDTLEKLSIALKKPLEDLINASGYTSDSKFINSKNEIVPHEIQTVTEKYYGMTEDEQKMFMNIINSALELLNKKPKD